jgi:hypothetical protein
MTVNNDETNNYGLASEHWIDAYDNTSHVDLESFEIFSTQFLEQVNNPVIDAKNLIGKLCLYTFSGIAISSMAKYHSDTVDKQIEEIPVLTLILHPFKESRSITFGKKEVLFGVSVNNDNPKKEVKTIEFIDPSNLFAPWTDEVPAVATTVEDPSTAESEKDKKPDGTKTTIQYGIRTPTFLDFFDDNFLKGNPRDEEYQPLNNATEIKSTAMDDPNLNKNKDQDTESFPNPFYHPRKIIPLSPAFIRVIFEQREYNFDGAINGIREYAWNKLKSFSKAESRKKFLFLIYRTIQALWTHGQRETPNGSPMDEFIRCDPKKVAKLTSFKWAIDKPWR